MNGVLVVAHGSRAKETEQTIEVILKMVTEKLENESGINTELIETAYMEFNDSKSIEVGLKKLIEKDVASIKIVPYFLFEGIHIKDDIPKEVNRVMENYPNIAVKMGEVLGTDWRLADILIDRIKG